jgi:hypothetical protein
MKKTLFLLLTMVLISLSCTKKDKSDELTQDILFQMIVSATWEIYLFAEDDEIETSDFTNFKFTFLTTSVVKATDGTNTYEGTWYTVKDNNEDSPDGLTFHISFEEPESFMSLTEDWSVISANQAEIRLKHVSGGDGTIDFLSFGI